MQWFSFPLPITWDEVATIATSAAVIVALFANVNSNKQLKKALQMHEQTKNLGLFDRRLDLLSRILDDDAISEVSDDEVELLFNNSILKKVQNKRKQLDMESTIRYELKEYFEELQQKDLLGKNHEDLRQIFLEQYLLSEEYEGFKPQYLKFCKKYELMVDGEVYNYSDLTDSLGQILCEIRKNNEDIQNEIKIFIRDSIQELK